MQHSSLIKEELSLCTRSPAAGSVGVTAKCSLRQLGDCWWGGSKVSMYEVLMNQYLGDLENVVPKVQARYMAGMKCHTVLEQRG